MRKITQLLLALLVILTVSTVSAKDKVVVIPLGGDDFKANGKSCPQGQLVTGFTASGGLVCASLGEISPIRFLGVTQTSFSGAVSFSGQNGLAGARAACSSSFPSEPGARFCTSTDIDRILQLDNTPASIISELNNRNLWASFHGTGGTLSDTNTDQNNCHNLSYNSGETATGTRLTISFDAAVSLGIVADRAQYWLSSSCNTQLPLLCCAGN